MLQHISGQIIHNSKSESKPETFILSMKKLMCPLLLNTFPGAHASPPSDANFKFRASQRHSVAHFRPQQVRDSGATVDSVALRAGALIQRHGADDEHALAGVPQQRPPAERGGVPVHGRGHRSPRVLHHVGHPQTSPPPRAPLQQRAPVQEGHGGLLHGGVPALGDRRRAAGPR